MTVKHLLAQLQTVDQSLQVAASCDSEDPQAKQYIVLWPTA